MKKILKTVKNVSGNTLLVRNSDGVKKEVSNNGTFVTYKRKELTRIYSSYFTVISENTDNDVYKITAISESVVSIVDKKGKEIISMKIETVEGTDTLYLGINNEWKEETDSDTITLIEGMLTEVVAGDNIVSKTDTDTLVAEYNSLS